MGIKEVKMTTLWDSLSKENKEKLEAVRKDLANQENGEVKKIIKEKPKRKKNGI